MAQAPDTLRIYNILYVYITMHRFSYESLKHKRITGRMLTFASSRKRTTLLSNQLAHWLSSAVFLYLYLPTICLSDETNFELKLQTRKCMFVC